FLLSVSRSCARTRLFGGGISRRRSWSIGRTRRRIVLTRRRHRSRRFLFEKIAELIFTEARGAWNQIHAGNLNAFCSLRGIKQNVRSVRTPGHVIAENVRKERHRLGIATRYRRDCYVPEILVGRRNQCQPTAVGRPHKWAGRTERRAIEMSRSGHVFLLGRHVQHDKLLGGAKKREHL